MRTGVLFAAALAAGAVAGCGGPVAKLGELSRVQAAVFTDAAALSGGAAARPPVQVTDPDRLAAIEAWMRRNAGRWQKASGPRPTRYQLELIGDGRPMLTMWLDHGYAMSAEGKKLREMRLSNAESAELLACFGLPPDYMAAPSGGVDYGPPRNGVVDGPLTPLKR